MVGAANIPDTIEILGEKEQIHHIFTAGAFDSITEVYDR